MHLSTRHLSSMLLTLLLAVMPGHAQDPATARQVKPLIVSPTLPKDERGETVYEQQSPRTLTVPTAPGVAVLPKPVNTPSPIYPESLRKAKLTANLIVDAVVTQTGDVSNIVFHDASGLNAEQNQELKEAALSALQQYRFQPATLDGTPIAFRFRAAMAFKIVEKPTEPPSQ